ncbi:MAG: c-type cytochrome [Chloroflexi bacterium]|nr:c-type cytochrome [Chloroflexota bacterium]
MKLKLLAVIGFGVLLLWSTAAVVMAQEEPPAPYAGMKNPFPWDDTSVQQEGEKIYQQSCLGCHGITGSNVAAADFNAAGSSAQIEERPDFYFWTVSEGRLTKGMPPFKSSLSEEQRWKVLTYLWTLSQKKPEPAPVPPAQPAGNLSLVVSGQGQTGQPLPLTASLQDTGGKPITNAAIKFFIQVDFFTTGFIEIGNAVTNDRGVATLEYVPRQARETTVMARYQATETTAAVTILDGRSFYHTEAGMRLPSAGPEVFIGPRSSFELEMGSAPMTALRLPGGLGSWLWLFIGVVMTIWMTYFRVFYQLFRIPIRNEMRNTNTRLVPLLGFIFVAAVGTLLVLMLLTYPYSHLHLGR